jgi:hypothetical protein
LLALGTAHSVGLVVDAAGIPMSGIGVVLDRLVGIGVVGLGALRDIGEQVGITRQVRYKKSTKTDEVDGVCGCESCKHFDVTS